MFDSCSAYQISDELLYLSHCVPNPPDKGERIRSHHQVRELARRFRVHVVCFGKDEADFIAARQLESLCASVHVERLDTRVALFKAAAGFVAGESLASGYYGSRRLRAHVASISSKITAAVAFSVPMAQYAPKDRPLFLDMVDVDSEKWLDYAKVRWPGFLYRAEADRLRSLECREALSANCTFVTTQQESRLMNVLAPGAHVKVIENGVESEYYDPRPYQGIRKSRTAVFLGAMDYYPNVDGVCWFANRVFRQAHAKDPDSRFFIVGRNPTPAVQRLRELPGVEVTGAVRDVRPYLASASVAVAPLRIVRGIQNKVLQALSMGLPVLASTAICSTFGGNLPAGVIHCKTPEDYLRGLTLQTTEAQSEKIRTEAAGRFCWRRNLSGLLEELGEHLPPPLLRAAGGA